MNANLLVVSDLHLGEDIGTSLGERGDARVALTERELARFFDHHATHREDARPWHLVINGDMADFLAMILMPGDVGVITGLDEDDHWYGLGTTAPAAQIKVTAVLDRHDGVFRALARFLLAGNEVSIIIGNHDVEFHWPEAQRVFRDRLNALARELGDIDVADAIHFHPWFFFDNGVWIEHGHLYDPYCSVDDVLDPFTDDGHDLDPSVSGWLMRYLNNHYAPHSGHAEPWGFAAYLTWFLSQGATRMSAILSAFVRMNQRLLQVATARATPGKLRRARRRRHLAKLRVLAERFQLDPDAVSQVDALRKRPVVVDRTRLVQALMLDRLVLTLATAMLVLSAFVVLSWSGFAAVTAALALMLLYANHKLHHSREPQVSTKSLLAVGRRIRQLVKARIVVFGHTHDPVAEHDEDGSTFNTGSWVPDEHVGLRRAFTHLRIVRRGAEKIEATLCRWADGRSELLS